MKIYEKVDTYATKTSLNGYLKNRVENAWNVSLNITAIIFGHMILEPKIKEEQKVDRMIFAFTVLTEKLNPNLFGFSDESRFQLVSDCRGVLAPF